MSTLERAIAIAAQAHAGQRDKAGAPYVLHPLRMMLRLKRPEERIAAVLHDVLEDTAVSLADLRTEGFPEAVLAAVDALSRRADESYEEFVDRAASNEVARRVKLEDLFDNSDLSRIDEPTDRDRRRIGKYQEAIRRILRCTFTDDPIEGILEDATFHCSRCGDVAGRLTLVRTTKGVVMCRDSFTSVMGGGGYLHPDETRQLIEAMAASDAAPALFRLDLELTPFYCPVCDAVYCRKEWNWWTTFDDDGFSDTVRGRCPNGHGRMLED